MAFFLIIAFEDVPGRKIHWKIENTKKLLFAQEVTLPWIIWSCEGGGNKMYAYTQEFQVFTYKMSCNVEAEGIFEWVMAVRSVWILL